MQQLALINPRWAMRAAKVTVVVPCVCMYVCVHSNLLPHIGITKERYQRIHRNIRTVLNFADFPKMLSSKVMA